MRESELIINADGSVYHLNLLPEDLATTIILVGDPDRVGRVSQHFDRVDIKKQKREFVTHTGELSGQRISVVSTGIGVGNIDIVMNELDALANIDFATRNIKSNLTSLRIVRLGTCGCLRSEVPVDSFIVSNYAFAFDGILKFYQQNQDKNLQQMLSKIENAFATLPVVSNAYVAQIDNDLRQTFSEGYTHGITLTCPGFYGPQNRQLRGKIIQESIFELAQQFEFDNLPVTNFEMETAAIYGLGNLLDHQVCSISTAIANRATQQFSSDPIAAVDRMIETSLQQLTTSKVH